MSDESVFNDAMNEKINWLKEIYHVDIKLEVNRYDFVGVAPHNEFIGIYHCWNNSQSISVTAGYYMADDVFKANRNTIFTDRTAAYEYAIAKLKTW